MWPRNKIFANYKLWNIVHVTIIFIAKTKCEAIWENRQHKINEIRRKLFMKEKHSHHFLVKKAYLSYFRFHLEICQRQNGENLIVSDCLAFLTLDTE